MTASLTQEAHADVTPTADSWEEADPGPLLSLRSPWQLSGNSGGHGQEGVWKKLRSPVLTSSVVQREDWRFTPMPKTGENSLQDRGKKGKIYLRMPQMEIQSVLKSGRCWVKDIGGRGSAQKRESFSSMYICKKMRGHRHRLLLMAPVTVFPVFNKLLISVWDAD